MRKKNRRKTTASPTSASMNTMHTHAQTRKTGERERKKVDFCLLQSICYAFASVCECFWLAEVRAMYQHYSSIMEIKALFVLLHFISVFLVFLLLSFLFLHLSLSPPLQFCFVSLLLLV